MHRVRRGFRARAALGVLLSDSPKPKNLVVVLLDSLNRHFLDCYLDEAEQRARRRATGVGDWADLEPVATPNIDRLAARSLRFEKHWSGSLPCMPARHDLLVGALDFLWRPWGSIEIWEDAITYDLQRAGVTTMLVSDHPHLFEIGGENYHTDFTAWLYERGHESDPWRTRPDPTWTGTPALPAEAGFVHHAYDDSRTWFREEGDFPGPRTMQAAEQWLRTSARDHDRFLLFVDEFDPHEPFDTPEQWATRYDPEWDGPRLIWPPYSTETIAKGRLQPNEARQIRANYQSKLAMIDHWLGRILDALDDLALWDDTAFVLCTDHGHYLGERDAFGKPGIPVFSDLGHTPLLVAWPGVAPRRGRCAHDQRRPARDVRRRVRDRARAPHARSFARAVDPRRDRCRARARAARLLGAPCARRRHGTALRAGPGR